MLLLFMKGCVFMSQVYNYNLKKKICSSICLDGASTSNVAKEFNIPLKTVEKWITAFNKDNSCFDNKVVVLNNNIDFVDDSNNIDNYNYDDLSIDELKNLLMKKDIEIARLKKNYRVKEGGTENKVFISLSKKNMK